MKKKMWFVLCIMTSVLLTTACGEKKEPGEEKKETAVQTETAMQTETVVQTETESDQDFQGREKSETWFIYRVLSGRMEVRQRKNAGR